MPSILANANGYIDIVILLTGISMIKFPICLTSTTHRMGSTITGIYIFDHLVGEGGLPAGGNATQTNQESSLFGVRC